MELDLLLPSGKFPFVYPLRKGFESRGLSGSANSKTYETTIRRDMDRVGLAMTFSAVTPHMRGLRIYYVAKMWLRRSNFRPSAFLPVAFGVVPGVWAAYLINTPARASRQAPPSNPNAAQCRDTQPTFVRAWVFQGFCLKIAILRLGQMNTTQTSSLRKRTACLPGALLSTNVFGLPSAAATSVVQAPSSGT